MNMLQFHNGIHHHHNIEHKIYTSNNYHNQRLQSLNIKVTKALKLRLTLKQVYIISTISNMILPEDYPSVLMVDLYVELNITSISMIVKNKSAIRPRVSYSSMICGHTILTQKPRG